MSRKEPSFSQLIQYIEKSAQESSPVLCHNFYETGEDLKEVERVFLENYQYHRKKKGWVVCYHEVISFSEKDRPFLTMEIISDVNPPFPLKSATIPE